MQRKRLLLLTASRDLATSLSNVNPTWDVTAVAEWRRETCSAHDLVVLDCGGALFTEWLDAVSTEKRTIPTVAVGSGPLQTASLADALIDDWVARPDEICIDRARQSFLSRPDTLSEKSVQGRSLAYTTRTPSMFDTISHLTRMARHDVTLLLVGETGTGKTTVAKLVHELSSRWSSPLVTVACGAMPPELIESELFGHVRGAFTGADRDKDGKFAAAANGTLLLDEIDVLTFDQQAKLLRVIETGEYEPVGSNDTVHSHARLIAASNRDLQQLMNDQDFRADLFYRLNVLEFRLPPLRERPADIVPLAVGFIQEFCQQHDVVIERVHPDFFAALKSYGWPGNIRELKNHVRRAVLFCQSAELSPNDLAQQCLASAASSNRQLQTNSLSEQVARSEREILEEALQLHNQNRTKTAAHLGISRVGLYKKMRRFGMLDPSKCRSQRVKVTQR